MRRERNKHRWQLFNSLHICIIILPHLKKASFSVVNSLFIVLAIFNPNGKNTWFDEFPRQLNPEPNKVFWTIFHLAR